MYKLSDFNFNLPLSLVAQTPTKERDKSNLLLASLLQKQEHEIVKFHQIIDYLSPGDVLVFNDSKVVNAQLTLKKDSKNININLHKCISKNIWLGYAKPSKMLSIGDVFNFDNHKICISNKLEFGEIEFQFILNNIDVFSFLEAYGEIPLPQYIKRNINHHFKSDLNRYQTVYSKVQGSVAAPTAGLHFTKALIDKIRNKKVEIAFITLHVGAGTFLPVKTEDISKHPMHFEWCEVSKQVAYKINNAKKLGSRIIAVGTTTMRAIESCAIFGVVVPKAINTNLLITPGYNFQITDMLITNFHLPKSTLFMLVCAFSGYKEMHSIYRFAIDKKMRFFSYGDVMLLNKK